MARRDEDEQISTLEAYERLRLDELLPLGPLVAPKDPPTRKRDLVPVLVKAMAKEETVKKLYEGMDEINRAAVQEAVHEPDGELDRTSFRAKYGRLPDFGSKKRASAMNLFLPTNWQIPKNLHAILRGFVPPPRQAAAALTVELPEAIPPVHPGWSVPGEQKNMPLRVKATAAIAGREVRLVLRMIDAGKLRVTEKTRRPNAATVEALTSVLVGGDFYDEDDAEPDYGVSAADLAIRAFAWPLLAQEGGLAGVAKAKLRLTVAGRKAMGMPPHDVLRALWRKWLETDEFDEFARIDVIKGQKRARLSDVAERRESVVETLRAIPVGSWVAVDELFDFLISSGRNFEIAEDEWALYLFEQEYGSFGYDDENTWCQLQGRFILAMLFEYAATLGLLDVAYIRPQGARDDVYGRWGTDDLAYLSRYDGLKYVRINPLGAWCLGLAAKYEPEPEVTSPRFRVLPNFDVVVTDRPADPGDMLLLDQVAERGAESVWRLDRTKLLSAVEGGLDLADVESSLSAGAHGPLPQTVVTLLSDVRERSRKLRDLGLARLIECADAETARLLISDRPLGKLCHLSGDRLLVFPSSDESAVRARLHKLGFILPLPD